MRVWSFLRFPGSACAKAIRDMRSPPKTACGLRLETEAICSPEASSISVVTTLVVPMSMARPNLWSAVSPDSTARMRRPKRVTVTSPWRFAEGGGQGLPDVGGHVVDGGAGGGQQLLEVRGLVMLVLGKRDLHDLLVDPGVEGHGGRRAGQPLAAEDLKAALVDGGGDLDGRRRDHRALAGEAIAVADQPLAELELIRDGGRRCCARDELDPARRAPTAPAAGRRDVDAGGVRRLQDGRSGCDVEGAATGKNGQDRAHSGLRIPLPP